MEYKVAVIGAGIIGLSSAVNISELRLAAGSRVRVTLITDAMSPDTTGDGAAGFWEPHLAGDTPLPRIK